MPHAEIRNFIDSFSRLLPAPVARRYRGATATALCGRIAAAGGKGLPESVLILRCAVDSLAGEDFFAEASDGDFERFAAEREEELLGLCARRSVQANIPGRALPIAEVAGALFGGGPYRVLELGASAGLIGAGLLGIDRAVAGAARYFEPGQQLPAAPRDTIPRDSIPRDSVSGGVPRAAAYLGIERDPPGRDWALACVPKPDDRGRMRAFYADFLPAAGFELLRADAFGFAALPEARAFSAGPEPLVLLTSFMLYQFDPAGRDRLEREVRAFVAARPGARWINLGVRTEEPDPARQCYLAVDGKEILALSDDSCRAWKPA